jgi:hypothetical protein
LIVDAALDVSTTRKKGGGRLLQVDDMSSVFGIELEARPTPSEVDEPAARGKKKSSASKRASGREGAAKKTTTKKIAAKKTAAKRTAAKPEIAGKKNRVKKSAAKKRSAARRAGQS